MNMNTKQCRLVSIMLLAVLITMSSLVQAQTKKSATTDKKPATAAQTKKPNIIIIWGDDIGQTNISAYSMGLMGYKTPNLDRVAKSGVLFTDYYAEQSCTAGRASFITGQCGLRTGLTKVGAPGASAGLQDRDVTIAQL